MKFNEFLFSEAELELTENEIKYKALENMKGIQAQLGSVSFIDVISAMREDNPLKEEVFEMENMLHELTTIVSAFINDNLPDAVEVTDDEADKDDEADEADEEIAKQASKEEE